MSLQMFATVFVTVFVAELGDKTQLATILYSADGRVSAGMVFVAASAALVLSTALGVLVGGWLGDRIPEQVLRWVAGSGFIAVGVWTLLRS